MLELSTELVVDLTQFEDFFATKNDLVVFLYSSSVDHEMNRRVVEQYALLAQEMKLRGEMKNLLFLSYDLNLLGISPRLGNQFEHPNMILFPGKHRSSPPKLYNGDTRLDNMAAYIKKQVDYKISADFEGLDREVEFKIRSEEARQ